MQKVEGRIERTEGGWEGRSKKEKKLLYTSVIKATYHEWCARDLKIWEEDSKKETVKAHQAGVQEIEHWGVPW